MMAILGMNFALQEYLSGGDDSLADVDPDKISLGFLRQLLPDALAGTSIEGNDEMMDQHRHVKSKMQPFVGDRRSTAKAMRSLPAASMSLINDPREFLVVTSLEQLRNFGHNAWSSNKHVGKATGNEGKLQTTPQ